jgi:hypothetical protein
MEDLANAVKVAKAAADKAEKDKASTAKSTTAIVPVKNPVANTALQQQKTGAIVAPPRDADQETKKQYINTLVGRYPQGITEEKSKEGNCSIVKLIVVKGTNASVFRKSTWSWGQTFYFKDDISITEASFNEETQK